MKTSPLRLKGVVKKVGDFILHADFCVDGGERAALIGVSGSGKTTLLRIIVGLEPLRKPFDGGQIFLGDREVTSISPQAREVGLIFQDAALFSGLNVLDNVTFGLRVRKVSRAERVEQGLIWLEKIGLRSKAQTSVEALSGGEKQRVAFARALIWKPKVLLLDEPFSSLDAGLKKELAAQLLELHQQWPVPLILVSHDEADIQSLATRRLYLEVRGHERSHDSLQASIQERHVVT